MRASVVFSGRALLLAALLVSGAVSISGCAQLQSLGQTLENAQTPSPTVTSGKAGSEERKRVGEQASPLAQPQADHSPDRDR